VVASGTDAAVEFVFELVGVRFDYAEAASDEVVGCSCDGLRGSTPVYIYDIAPISLPYVLSPSRNLETSGDVRSAPASTVNI
jgi:hypothetical protein